MQHLRVTTKLWLGVVAIVLGAVLIVGHAGYNSASHQRKFNQHDALLSQRLHTAGQWNALAQTNIVRSQAMLSSPDSLAHHEFVQQSQAAAQTIQDLQRSLQASGLAPQDHAAMQQLIQLEDAMLQQQHHAQQLQSTGQWEAARHAVQQQWRPATEAYAQALERYVQQQANHLAQMRADMGAARQGVVRTAAINMVFLLLAIALGAALLIGSIRRALAKANQVAEHMAAGDLSASGSTQRHDEFGQLLQSLQRMSVSLSHMVYDVQRSGDAIHAASHDIAAGNQELSQRTEHTANHLQQAAAAMLQLTETIQATAQSAQQATGLAQKASGVALQGGSVVNDVVQAMTDIHGRSQQIADIIGVIDSIAFQTNILALNAAVEAARAGEQGRGFAVVAAEVRTLAQRSAQAAKEIKTLIQASVDRIGDGARLVQTAGSTMTEVVQSIQRVTQVMERINHNASEQRDGMAQINEAVGSLEQMTQQNAALVQESTAAAESLRAQSQQLRALVQRFQTPSLPAQPHPPQQPWIAAPALPQQHATLPNTARVQRPRQRLEEALAD